MHLPTKINIVVNKLDVYSQKQKSYDAYIFCKILKIRNKFLNDDSKIRKVDLILIVNRINFEKVLGVNTMDFTIQYRDKNYEVLTIDSMISYSNDIDYYEISCVEIK